MIKSGNKKILLIGIDGGTFNILNPFIKEGLLPNIASMMDKGTYGVLESTIPPVTAPAWASFMTGKNPGKHGVLQFFNFDSDMKNVKISIYDAETPNYLSIKEPTIFDYLKGTGKKIISINIPMTYPPQELDGYMISCWLTPPDASIFTYPPDLKNEITEYRIDQYFGESKFALLPRDNKLSSKDYFADLDDVLEKRGETALKLLKNKEWDLFMICFTETDRIQHLYWRCINPEYPGYESEEITREREAFKSLYKKLDGFIGNLAKEAGEDAIKIIVSDHGFDKPPAKRVSINYWLREMGWLSFRHKGTPLHVFRSAVKNILPTRVRKFVTDLNRIKEIDIFAAIDLSKTVAWSINLHNHFGGIFFNKESLTPNLQGEIMKGLLALTEKATDKKIVKDVWEKQNIYKGENAGCFPDLIYQLEENYEAGPEGYYDLTSSSFMTDNPYPTGRGNHTREGIYILDGDVIQKKGYFKKYPIESILPTLLFLLDSKIPKDVDGNLMTEILMPSFLQANPPRFYSDQEVKEMITKRNIIHTDANYEESIKSKLKDLGYLG